MAVQIRRAQEKLKTPHEMDEIRAKQAIINERMAKERKPEPDHIRIISNFQVGRYDKGPNLGMFVVYEAITHDRHGDELPEPKIRTIASGVDMFIASTEIRRAIHARLG